MAEDPDTADTLISVAELALRWQTPESAVAPLVANGTIPALDGGWTARQGRLGVPVLRASWAERTRVDSPGALRRLDVELGEQRLHPAATVALDLHLALAERDAAAVWELSSASSRDAAGDPENLLGRWLDALGDIFSVRTGIATGVYALVPRRGVGVRLVDGLGPWPVRYDRPTPQQALGLIVLVPEENGWRADLPLTADDVDYTELVHSAPPDGWTPPDGPLP